MFACLACLPFNDNLEVLGRPTMEDTRCRRQKVCVTLSMSSSGKHIATRIHIGSEIPNPLHYACSDLRCAGNQLRIRYCQDTPALGYRSKGDKRVSVGYRSNIENNAWSGRQIQGGHLIFSVCRLSRAIIYRILPFSPAI